MAYIKTVFLLMIMFCMTACNILSPAALPEKKTYLLQDPVSTTKDVPLTYNTYNKKILLVSRITSPAWLDTSQMAYQVDTNQINYFARHAWAASPSELLQPIVAHALSASLLYRAVISAPFNVNGNYNQILNIHLLDMQQVFNQTSSYYKLAAQVELIDKDTGRIRAVKRFDIVAPSTAYNPQSGVLAANEAVREWMRQLIVFIKKTA